MSDKVIVWVEADCFNEKDSYTHAQFLTEVEALPRAVTEAFVNTGGNCMCHSITVTDPETMYELMLKLNRFGFAFDREQE